MRFLNLTASVAGILVVFSGVAQAQSPSALSPQCINFKRVYEDIRATMDRRTPVMLDTVDAGLAEAPQARPFARQFLRGAFAQAVQHFSSMSRFSGIESWIPYRVEAASDLSAFEMYFTGMRIAGSGINVPNQTGPFKIRRTCRSFEIVGGTAPANIVQDQLVIEEGEGEQRHRILSEEDVTTLVTRFGFSRGRTEKRVVLACNRVNDAYTSCALIEGFNPTYAVRYIDASVEPAFDETVQFPMSLVRMTRWGAPNASAYQFQPVSSRLARFESRYLFGEAMSDVPAVTELLAPAIADQVLSLTVSVLPTTLAMANGTPAAATGGSSRPAAEAFVAPAAERPVLMNSGSTIAPAPATTPEAVAPASAPTPAVAPVPAVLPAMPRIPMILMPELPRTSGRAPAPASTGPAAGASPLAGALNEYLVPQVQPLAH